MKAKSLIPILAEIWGVDQDRADKIDRSLADGGMRAKGKGRAVPEMTRLEAIHFLIGCMVTRVPSRAADEALPWIEADGLLPVMPVAAPDVDEWDDESDLSERLKIYNATQPFFEKMAYPAKSSKLIKLTDYLLILCRLFESPRFNPDGIIFRISTSHPMATIEFQDNRGAVIDSLGFFDKTDQSDDMIDPRYAIDQSATVYGGALLAIAARTKDPLQMENQA
ncbi:hypothetical protein DL1_11235 [Thioclava dalianensis]|uniref:Uncharacterized protein n=1 Tax=Thioclava dalianensis TaxID=1185766 RepID=A0A074THM4_9RHOB|nr:hypothetical protein [Thioclava dalianensis]KEP68538.1 hypothetical protein DL1_11235 [Thioclava dalianensis]SFN85081.1 hypothetical protein SAMN05216224_11750 [Thioclava dalianensis]